MKKISKCNKIEKVWRYRWYVLIPFKWMWYQVVGLKVYRDEPNPPNQYGVKFDLYRGKILWKLLVGDAQFKMNWFYTMEEVMSQIKG